ncbi:ribonuclease III [Candidatus Microgenomates bacterium]|jgi:ribonuclease-3|nr:MAG: ribonuclease III [Candidatus Microgenomates bacterium]
MNLLNNTNRLEESLGVTFENKELLERAMTHRSFLNEAKNPEIKSNERLEFLGDSILSFWVSEQIFKEFPDLPEGKLTHIRTHLVRTETLTKLARKLNLGEFLLMSKGEELGGGRENPLLLANCFEAVIGAVYLDQGIEKVSLFLKNNFEDLLSQIDDVEALKDSKSLLQELVQAEGHLSPVYKLISSSGPDHQKVFTMGVFIDERLIAQGTSRSKQEAEEESAKKALEILGKIK